MASRSGSNLQRSVGLESNAKLQTLIVNLKQKCEQYERALTERQSESQNLQRRVSYAEKSKTDELGRLRGKSREYVARNPN